MEYLFSLGEGLALLKDPLQYVVSEHRTRSNPKKGVWRHRFYSRFGRESLLKELARRRITPSQEAVAQINSLLPSDEEVLAGERRLRLDPHNAPDPRALRRDGAPVITAA